MKISLRLGSRGVNLADRASRHGVLQHLLGRVVVAAEEHAFGGELIHLDIDEITHPACIGIGDQLEPAGAVPLAQLFAAPGRQNATGADDDKAIAEAFDHIELARGEEHYCARRGTFCEHVEDDVDRNRVQAGQGLVQDQDVGVMDHRRGDLHPRWFPSERDSKGVFIRSVRPSLSSRCSARDRSSRRSNPCSRVR